MKRLTILLSLLMVACVAVGDNSVNVIAKLSPKSIEINKSLDSCLFQVVYSENSFLIYEERLETSVNFNFSVSPNTETYKFKVICNSTKSIVYYEKKLDIGKSSLVVDLGVIEMASPK